ncbi:MAG: HAD family phosphatase [Pseudomonadota bacterium]
MKPRAAIFDLGNVVVNWNPTGIVATLDCDAETQAELKRALFDHPDWLALDQGTTTEADVLARIHGSTGLNVDLIRSTFEATKLSFTEIPQTIALIDELHQTGIPMYCLSNMSLDSYAAIRERAFFAHFTGIVISAQENLLKPDPAIFRRLIERYDLQHHSLLFIDDMPENILAAEKLGLEGVLFDRSENAIEKIREYFYEARKKIRSAQALAQRVVEG